MKMKTRTASTENCTCWNYLKRERERSTVSMRHCCYDLLLVSTLNFNHLLTRADIRLRVSLKCQVGSKVGTPASSSPLTSLIPLLFFCSTQPTQQYAATSRLLISEVACLRCEESTGGSAFRTAAAHQKQYRSYFAI